MSGDLKSLLGPSAQHYAWCGLAAQAPLPGAGVDAVLSALALVYAGAAAWHHRRPTQKQGVCFAAGLLILGATLTGPLERLALERLFVAYIFQQFVAVMIAAPLLLLGLPDWMARAVFMNRVIQPAWRFATKPVTALLLFSAIFAFIHYPAVCDRVCHLRPAYYSIRFLLVLVGLMLWWPVLSPLTELYPAQILYLFLLVIPMTATAAPITMARSVLYSFYAWTPHPWGLSPTEDQTMGGLLMWVGQGIYVIGAMSLVFLRWVTSEQNDGALSARAGCGQ
jgi:putative membrane protein